MNGTLSHRLRNIVQSHHTTIFRRPPVFMSGPKLKSYRVWVVLGDKYKHNPKWSCFDTCQLTIASTILAFGAFWCRTIMLPIYSPTKILSLHACPFLWNSDPVHFASDQFGPLGASEPFKSVLDGLGLKRVFLIIFLKKHPFKSGPSKTLLDGSDAPNGLNWSEENGRDPVPFLWTKPIPPTWRHGLLTKIWWQNNRLNHLNPQFARYA